MTQAVVQVWHRWLHGNSVAVFINGLAIVSLGGLQVADQLVHAIRVGVGLIQAEIRSRGQLLESAGSPIECRSRMPVRYSGERLQRALVIPQFEKGTGNLDAKIHR